MRTRGLFAAMALMVGATACGQERRPGSDVELLDLTPEPMFVSEQLEVWDGEAYAVLIAGEPDHTPGDTQLYFARVAPTGELLTGPALLHDLDDPAQHLRLVVVDGAPNPLYLLVYYESYVGELHTLEFDGRGAHRAGPEVVLGESIASLAAASTFAGEDAPAERRVFFTEDIYSYPDPLFFLAEDGSRVEIGAPDVDKYDAELVYVPEAGHFLGFWVQNGRACVVPIGADGTASAAPRVISDTGTEQRRPQAVVDGSGNVLVAWDEPEEGTAALMALGPDGQALPSWEEPLAPFPKNRVQSFDVELGVDEEGQPLVAWESDVDSSLSQILAAPVDLGSGGALGAPVLVSDPMFPAENPVLSPSGGPGSGVTFGGRVDASERVFWAPIAGAEAD